jgi:uncharacterized membrane protein
MRYIVFTALIVSVMPVIATIGYFLARIREGGAPNALDLGALIVMLLMSFCVTTGAIWYSKKFRRDRGK